MFRQMTGPGRFDLRLLFALLLILSTTAAAVAERRVALVMADDDCRLAQPLAMLSMPLELDRSGRLAPRYKFMIKFLRERLAKAK